MISCFRYVCIGCKGFKVPNQVFGLFSWFVDADYDKVRIPPVLDDLSAHKGSCIAAWLYVERKNRNSAIINCCSTNNASTVDLLNRVNIDRRICISELALLLHYLSPSFVGFHLMRIGVQKLLVLPSLLQCSCLYQTNIHTRNPPLISHK